MSEPAVEPVPAENRPETAGARPGEPGAGKPFEKGKSGNPGGRPKGLARKVRETLGDDDGAALAGFWSAVLSGELRTVRTKVETAADGQTTTRQETVYEEIAVSDRIAVSKLLAERGWGKPPQFVPIDDVDPLGFSEREQDELAESLDVRLDELARKREEREARAASETP